MVWVLEVGEGEAEDLLDGRGTLRVMLLMLEASVSVSVSSVFVVSEEFFLRDEVMAVSLPTASLMCAGIRTQAKVRS